MKLKFKKGFTLIELLISVTLFSFVSLIALTALMSIIDANNITKAKKMVINNLNMAMESMTREIRVGYDYTCGFNSPVEGGINCLNGDTVLAFRTKNGNKAVFYYDSTQKAIKRRIEGKDSTDIVLIGENKKGELKIENLRFWVRGTDSGDGIQPSVFIVLEGKVEREFTSKFTLQSLISQRRLAP